MEGAPKRPLQVFLCHASQDKRVVRELARRLEGEGWIDVWLDEKKLLPGQDWRLAIEKAVEAADIVIICLSSNSVTKEGFIQKELRYAREIALEKPDEIIFLIPLRLDDCDIPRGLRFYHWGDYFGGKRNEAYSLLLKSLKSRYEHKLSLGEQESLYQGAEKETPWRADRPAAKEATQEKTDRNVPERMRQWLEKPRLEAVQRINAGLGWYKEQRITIRAAILAGVFAIVGGFLFGVMEWLKPDSPAVVHIPTPAITQTNPPTQLATLPLLPTARSSLDPNAAIVEKPTLSSPDNGISMPQKNEVTLRWNPARGAVQYKVEVWGGRYQKMTSCNWQDATICHIGQMWPGTMYWRVMARDDKGQASQWSDTWSFQIGMVPGYVELVEDLQLSTPSGNWPPRRGDKLIAHIRIRNPGEQPLQLVHIGVKGRRNRDEFWDIGFWPLTLNGDESWNFDPNNERPLESGEYMFQLAYSLDGTTWELMGSVHEFTVP